MQKTRKLILFGIVLVIIGLIGYTYSFLTHATQLKNRISVGYNSSEIKKSMSTAQHYEFNTTYKNEISVKNSGTVPCYVRILVLNSDSSIPVSIDLNIENWKLNGEYYYYNDVLFPNETSEPLFKQISIKSADTKKDFQIILYEETVQSESYSSSEQAFSDI